MSKYRKDNSKPQTEAEEFNELVGNRKRYRQFVDGKLTEFDGDDADLVAWAKAHGLRKK